jgi:PAS domain S-box-containing protein
VLNTTRVPLRDAQDNVIGFVGFIHEITERKQFERELEQARARTEEILESINVPLVISRVSDGIVAYVNEPLADIIRMPREELIGKITPDFYHNPADREAYLKGLREKGQVSNYDLRLKRSDGDPLWTLVSGRVINFQGEPAIISSLVDVSDRREAQATVARRATELETVANVSAVASAALEPDDLMEQVVDLTKERFNLYHAHLYLLNESKADLVLVSGAGDVGTKMVAEGRSIALTLEQSLVARAARTKTGVVINNVQEEPGFLPHPLLPETRAEMAVPLIVGNEILGVLDVQADTINRFTAEDINIFTTLASQVAVALQNARRHNEALKALDELTRLQRIMVREGWEDYLTTRERPYLGYTFNNKGAKPIEHTEKEAAVAKETETSTAGKGTETAIPIAVRGELIGQIALRNPDGRAIPDRKQSLIKTVARQVSEALERVRLTEQTQQALTQAEKRGQEPSLHATDP